MTHGAFSGADVPNDERLHSAWSRTIYPYVPKGKAASMGSMRLWMQWAVYLGVTPDKLPLQPWIPLGNVGPILILGHWDDSKDKSEDALIPTRFSSRALVPRAYYEQALEVLKNNYARPPSGGFHTPDEPATLEEDPVFMEQTEALKWMYNHLFVTMEEATQARSTIDNPQLIWPPGWVEAADFLRDQRPLIDIQDAHVSEDMQRVVDPFMCEQYRAVCFFKTDRAYYVAIPDPHDLAFEYALKARFELPEEQEKEIRLVRAVGGHVVATAKSNGKSVEEPLVTTSYDQADIVVALNLKSDDLKNVHYKDMDLTPQKMLEWILYKAVTSKASDIHMEGGTSMARVRMRIGPDLYNMASVSLDTMRQVVGIGRNTCGMGESSSPQDGRFTFRLDNVVFDVRASSMPTNGWPFPKLNYRLLSKDLRPLAAAGLSADHLKLLQKVIRQPKGLILVTGPTGSGKTTTLYGALSEINTPDINIHTAEDPVEYQLEGITQHMVDKGRGNTFAVLLRMLLRQDPDVVLVGEIRDKETAEIAVEAAMTGHLVFATLHTNSGAAAPARLIQMGVEPYLLGDTLICVEGQRLIKALCPHCKEPTPVTDKIRKYYECNNAAQFLEGVNTLYKPKGCPQCIKGYLGRVLVAEVYPVYGEFSESVARNEGERKLVERYSKAGYRSMFVDGLRRAALGQTTIEEAGQHNANWATDDGVG